MLAIMAVAGCAQSEMQFHFAAADLDEENPHLTFYRVTIRGVSGGEKSRLLTGFYSADALHSLFGKVEEKKGDCTETSDPRSHVGNITVEYNPTTKSWRVVEENERFTVFWGSNADAMAQQVGAFAESSQAGNDLASILAAAAGRDKFDALRVAQRTAEEKEQARTALSDALTSLKSTLEGMDASNLSSDEILEILRQAAQEALNRAGADTVLPKDPAEAVKKSKMALDVLHSVPKAGV